MSRYPCVVVDVTWRYPSPYGRVLSEVSRGAVSRIGKKIGCIWYVAMNNIVKVGTGELESCIQLCP